jgi:hypothetical protein
MAGLSLRSRINTYKPASDCRHTPSDERRRRKGQCEFEQGNVCTDALHIVGTNFTREDQQPRASIRSVDTSHVNIAVDGQPESIEMALG